MISAAQRAVSVAWVEGWIESGWQLVGWLGIACFFSRFLVQWLASERAGESVAPRVFWVLSAAGASLLMAYTLHRGEPVLLAGYVVTLFIYLRNLWLWYSGDGHSLGPAPLTAVALMAWATLVWMSFDELRPGWGDSRLWLVIGAVGQSVWSSRFVVQWVFSEREGHSHFPQAFWWISLVGNTLLLAYALRLGDPVWIAGLCLGPVVQIRNLMLIQRTTQGVVEGEASS